MALNYTWEKLFLAVLEISRSTDPLQKRIDNAYSHHISHAVHDAEQDTGTNITEDIKAGLQNLEKKHSGSKTLNDADAFRMIEETVSLYDEVTRAYARTYKY
jgi:hypothetical protein